MNVRAIVTVRNTGNAEFRVMNVTIGLYNSKSFAKTFSYRYVRPRQYVRIDHTFNNVPSGKYTFYVEVSDETGKKIKEVTRSVYVPAYKGKHASIKILGYDCNYIRVKVWNDGTVSDYFWIGASICSYDYSQCYDIYPTEVYLYAGQEKELTIWFCESCVKQKVTIKPRKVIVAVWEGFDGKYMIKPMYDKYETYWYC